MDQRDKIVTNCMAGLSLMNTATHWKSGKINLRILLNIYGQKSIKLKTIYRGVSNQANDAFQSEAN